MKQFNDENFLLDTSVAQELFHEHAAKMPIIDYHCHLIPPWWLVIIALRVSPNCGLVATTISGEPCVPMV